MSLGKSIRLLRLAMGWKFDDLSTRADVDVGTLNALEKRESQRSKFATKIATQGFGISLETLETINDEASAYSIANAVKSGKFKKVLSIAEQISAEDHAEVASQIYVSTPIHAINVPVIHKTEAMMLRDLIFGDLTGREMAILSDPPGVGPFYAMQIDDDSMFYPGHELSIQRGSRLIVDFGGDALPSALVIVRGSDGMAYCRQIINDTGRRMLRPLNPQYTTIPTPVDETALLGVVIEVQTIKRLSQGGKNEAK